MHKRRRTVTEIPLLPPPQDINLSIFADNIENIMQRLIVPDNSPFKIAIARSKKPIQPKSCNNRPGRDTAGFTKLFLYSGADAIRNLQSLDIPIVFCSSKTRAEQQVYREELGINAPFIVENGGAVYIPKDYFRLPFHMIR